MMFLKGNYRVLKKQGKGRYKGRVFIKFLPFPARLLHLISGQ